MIYYHNVNNVHNNNPHDVLHFTHTHLLCMSDGHQTNHPSVFGCVSDVRVPVCVCVCVRDSEPTVRDAFQPRNHDLLAKLRARQSCTFRREGGLILLRNPQLYFQQ